MKGRLQITGTAKDPRACGALDHVLWKRLSYSYSEPWRRSPARLVSSRVSCFKCPGRPRLRVSEPSQQDLHPGAHSAGPVQKPSAPLTETVHPFTSRRPWPGSGTLPYPRSPRLRGMALGPRAGASGWARLLSSMLPGPPGSAAATPWPARLREPERLRYRLVCLAALPEC